jgi:hypothetical protein
LHIPDMHFQTVSLDGSTIAFERSGDRILFSEPLLLDAGSSLLMR